MDVQLPEVIEADDQPHPDYGGWHRFLTECTDLRGEHEGVMYFGVVNCNYIVFPSGLLIQNYGYHGEALMAEVRANGVEATEKALRDQKEEIRKIMEMVRSRP